MPPASKEVLIPKGNVHGRSRKKVQQKMRRSARQLQHRRFGHVRSERLRQTTWSNWVQGLQYLGAHDRITCDCCMRMNAKKTPFDREAEERSSIPGERIHSDVKELPE